MLRFIRVMDRFSTQFGTYISYLVIVIMGVTVYEVVSRYIFNAPTFWAHETATFVYAAFILLPGAYTLRHLAMPRHIKMDIIYSKFSDRKQFYVDTASFIVFSIFLGVLIWQTALMARTSTLLLEKEPSSWGPPVWPVKVCMPVGIGLMYLQGVAKYMRRAYTFVTGREVE